MAIIASALTCVLISSVSHAGVVTVWGDASKAGDLDHNMINDFYNGLEGHSSSRASGTLDTVDLSSTNLLWATQPANAYTSAELSTHGVNAILDLKTTN